MPDGIQAHKKQKIKNKLRFWNKMTFNIRQNTRSELWNCQKLSGQIFTKIPPLYAATDGLEAAESLDLLFAKLSLRRSRCSFNRLASSFWYSAASDLAFAILFFFSAILARFLWSVNGVTSLCIFGALLTFFPAKPPRRIHYPFRFGAN